MIDMKAISLLEAHDHSVQVLPGLRADRVAVVLEPPPALGEQVVVGGIHDRIARDAATAKHWQESL
jgi:hypothetical protein